MALLHPRQLRAEADDLPGNRPHFSARELDRRDRIVATATALMARHGRAALTLANFALAIRMSRQAIQRHFIGLDCILAEIIHRHLQSVARAIGEVPHTAPDPAAARRAAYVAATRTPWGAPTPSQSLLLQNRLSLPPDLADPIDQTRLALAAALAPQGTDPETTLTLLDNPHLSPTEIEAMLAALAPPAPAALPPPKPRHSTCAPTAARQPHATSIRLSPPTFPILFPRPPPTPSRPTRKTAPPAAPTHRSTPRHRPKHQRPPAALPGFRRCQPSSGRPACSRLAKRPPKAARP